MRPEVDLEADSLPTGEHQHVSAEVSIRMCICTICSGQNGILC